MWSCFLFLFCFFLLVCLHSWFRIILLFRKMVYSLVPWSQLMYPKNSGDHLTCGFAFVFFREISWQLLLWTLLHSRPPQDESQSLWQAPDVSSHLICRDFMTKNLPSTDDHIRSSGFMLLNRDLKIRKIKFNPGFDELWHPHSIVIW